MAKANSTLITTKLLWGITELICWVEYFYNFKALNLGSKGKSGFTRLPQLPDGEKSPKPLSEKSPVLSLPGAWDIVQKGSVDTTRSDEFPALTRRVKKAGRKNLNLQIGYFFLIYCLKMRILEYENHIAC